MSKKENLLHEPIGRNKQNPFGIQHDPVNYYSPKYLSPKRLSSYAHQFRLALDTNRFSFLNIGSGNNVLSYLLTLNGKFVVNLDLDIKNHPSITGALPFLPFRKKTFDAVLCFQMLEHMPFDMFSICIIELMRISRSFIILSVPDKTLTKREKAKYRFYNLFKHPKEWSRYKKSQINKEHFWEIGHSNITTETILTIFQQHNLELIKHFRNKLSIYHHFFLLRIS